uniref:Uncharacterized protein n=1 Tax=Anguilla anguilla TaxID=7936 RepID=A0A0E9VAE6_ANGAN
MCGRHPLSSKGKYKAHPPTPSE